METMMNSRKKLLARRFIDILDRKELDKLGEVLSDEVVWHGTGGIGKLRGLENYKKTVDQVLRAFPDSTTSIDILLVDGDMVAIRYTMHGTHKREFMGFPPTEERVSMATNMIVRIEADKIEEIWHGADPVGLMMANNPFAKETS